MILKQENPVDAMRIEYKVKKFSASAWDDVCIDHMKQGLLAKFTQNKELGSFLLETKPQILVEASPPDTFWGIRLDLRYILLRFNIYLDLFAKCV